MKIGLGAATVFVAGMFVVTLGRQVKASTIDAFREGGTVKVPLSILPFTLDGHRVGSVREIQVDRAGGKRIKTVNVVINLKDIDASELGDCSVVVGAHGSHEFIGCLDAAEIEGMDLIRVGSVRFEPSGVSRPIMVPRGNMDDWFQGDAQAIIAADAEGQANFDIQGADGSRVQLQADGNGASIRVRDGQGKEIVKIDASSAGANVKVDSKVEKP
ncbi:MAG: hypothetical protein AABZ01_04820 [Gemmatimonadota bacterium]